MSESRRRQVWVRTWGDSASESVKASFSTRRVPREAMRTLVGGAVRPRPGDLVLASIARLGQHRKLETAEGRRAFLHLGDQIVVVYGDRYAPDQYESHVPSNLGPTQLVASGGIASSMISRSQDVRSATDITPIALIGDERGRPLNLADFALDPDRLAPTRPRTIAVVGTSMNSGKTTTIHYLAHALARAGVRPGVTKVTGTGSGGDYWVMLDAGVHQMLDFTDAGLASTYRQPMDVIERAMSTLLTELTLNGCGVRLVEVADGIFQSETSRLVASPLFSEQIDAVIFAAGDAMGAYAGVTHLKSMGFDVLAVSGKLTRSPLAVREAAEATGLPVLGIPELSDPVIAAQLLGVELPPTVEQGEDDALPSPWSETDLFQQVMAGGLPAPDPEQRVDARSPFEPDAVDPDSVRWEHVTTIDLNALTTTESA